MPTSEIVRSMTVPNAGQEEFGVTDMGRLALNRERGKVSVSLPRKTEL
jgi:hypothetical protein